MSNSPAINPSSSVVLEAKQPGKPTRSQINPLGYTRRPSMLEMLLRNRGATVAAVVLVAFVLTAILAPILAPYDPIKQNLSSSLMPPSLEGLLDFNNNQTAPHYFGTDKIGRDLLSRIIFGAQVTLQVGLMSVAFAALVGSLLGLLAGFYRGKVDTAIMILTDVQLSFPTILLAITIVAGLGPGLRNTIIVLSIAYWVEYARIIRAETLSLREQDFVLAARSIGCSNPRILFRHLVPQIISPLLVLITLQIGRVIILESALSFLGLGVQPPTPSWGNLLADGRELIWTAWWMAMFPGLALSLIIWSSNIFGDWLRDVLDPKLKDRP